MEMQIFPVIQLRFDVIKASITFTCVDTLSIFISSSTQSNEVTWKSVYVYTHRLSHHGNETSGNIFCGENELVS